LKVEQEGADDERNQESMADDADGFTQAASVFVRLSRLIAFTIPAGVARTVAERFLPAHRRSVRVKKRVLI